MFIMPRKAWLWQYWRRFLGLGLVVSGVGLPLPLQAAERLVLVAGDTTWMIPLVEVQRWVDSGHLHGSLTPLAQLLPAPVLENVRQWLTRPLPLTPRQSQRFLRTEAGRHVLQRLGQLLIPPDPQALKQALLPLGQQPQPLTVLRLLQSFPAETVAVDALAVMRLLLNAQTQQHQTAQALATFTLLPPQRSTPPFSGQPWQTQHWVFRPPDQPQRLLQMHVFYPGRSQAVPVVLLSHGIGQTGRSLMYLGEYLASQGFAAVVITHPASSALKEFWERPQDIRRVLAHLAQHPWHRRLDLQRVGLLGHSLGGYTVLVAAGAQPQPLALQHQCQSDFALLNLSLVLLQCRALELTAWPSVEPDPRIRAVIAMNPVIGGILGSTGLSSVRAPVMLVGGGGDWVTPVLPEQIQPFRGLQGKDHYLVIFPTAGHIDGLDETRQFHPARLPPLPYALAHLSREFFRAHLFPAAPALTPERLRQPTLPLRVIRSHSGPPR
jgi:predicted dienelactone hydrolase